MKLSPAVLILIASFASLVVIPVEAAETYTIDPTHTYPSFEADHQGISLWRGKFNKTSGTIVLDRNGKGGMLDIVIDASSVDFGHDKMNEHARESYMFNVAKFPKITYKSKSFKFAGNRLVGVDGEMTLLGVTKRVPLKIMSFKCVEHSMLKREVCGADASGEFNRVDFGLSYATPRFAPEVKLQIQVEAIKNDGSKKGSL